MYGREPAVSLDSALATRMDISPNYEVYQRQFLDKMERMQAQVLKNIERAQAKQKEYYDKKATEKNFQPGDLVFLKNPTRKKKLDPEFLGPFVVTETEKLPDNTIEVDELDNPGRPALVSKQRCKLYFQPQVPLIFIEEDVSHLFESNLEV